jgi:cytochrome c oxidase subunit I
LKLGKEPYRLFLIAAILLLVVALIDLTDGINLYFHESHYAFPFTNFIWAATILLFLFWGLYRLTKRFLFSTALIWIHVIFSLFCFAIIFISPYLSTFSGSGLAGMPRRYFDYSELSLGHLFNYFSPFVKVALVSLLLGQLVYLSNLFVGLSKIPQESHNSR